MVVVVVTRVERVPARIKGSANMIKSRPPFWSSGNIGAAIVLVKNSFPHVLPPTKRYNSIHAKHTPTRH